MVSSGTLYRVSLVRTDVSEDMSPSSGFHSVVRPRSCVTVQSLLISLRIEEYCMAWKYCVLWDVFTTATMKGVVFCDKTPCGSSKN
jgi:hypothetical protein